jgi:CubicO group peptidase (beta-lactamase class C family)
LHSNKGDSGERSALSPRYLWWLSVARRVCAFSVVVVVAWAGLYASSVSAAAQEDRLPPFTGSTIDDVEGYLERRWLEAGRPGLAAAVVRDGEVVSMVELGEARAGVGMTVDMPVFVASVSKSITAMALMQQVEAGRVDLDDPVTAYLPELAPEGEPVTVADLMHQRSGLVRYVGNEPWWGDVGVSLEANVERLGPFLEADAPFAYSNANYDALALIVQRVSGMPFDEYVSNEVFAPLGMNASFVGPNSRGRDVAEGHYHWLFLGYRPFDQPEPRGLVGSAVMYSSAEDLAHFLIAHLQGGIYDGNQVLSKDSVDRLHASESLGIELPEDYPVDVGYGGGLLADASFGPDVDDDLARMVTLWHDGSADGYRAMIWMIPEVGLGFVGLTNGNNNADDTWLPQVAQGVKYLIFGLDPPEVEAGSPFLLRYGKQLMLALVLVQIVLAVVTIRALHGPRRRRRNNAVFIVASIVDLTALAVIFWVIPTVDEAPLRVALRGVLQLPDFRILISAMSAGVLWGIYRTYIRMKRRHQAAPLNSRLQTS